MNAANPSSHKLEQLKQRFIEEYRLGSLCLHPTDSIPGLTFDPKNPEARKQMARFKGVRSDKAFVCLAGDLQIALRCWKPLSPRQVSFLSRIWPGPVSVIWQAGDAFSRELCHKDGSLCLRVPKLASKASWFGDVMMSLAEPVASTSVNLPGQPPNATWKDANDFLSLWPECHKPDVDELPCHGLPSTIIRLTDSGFEVLRPGAFRVDHLKNTWRDS